ELREPRKRAQVASGARDDGQTLQVGEALKAFERRQPIENLEVGDGVEIVSRQKSGGFSSERGRDRALQGGVDEPVANLFFRLGSRFGVAFAYPAGVRTRCAPRAR